MKLKKFLVLFLLITVVVSLAACNTTKYTVKFDTDGGSEIADQLVKNGKTATAPEVPTKQGYIFEGWYNGDEAWSFSTPITSDITLVAKWKQDTSNCPHADEYGDGRCDICGSTIMFKITYMDGQKQIHPKPDTYTMLDTDFTLPNATKKTNYEFVGWFADPEFTQPVTSIDVKKGGNITLYAKYDLVTYTIRYELNGGTNAAANPETYTVKDININLQPPTKDGYDFLGWYTDNAFTNPIEVIDRKNIGDFTIYARWAAPGDDFTVTYLDHNGNELLVETLYKSTSDQPLRSYTDFDQLNVEGYFFIAWVNANNEEERYVCIPAGNSEDMVVKATLKNEAVRHVLYYVDGGFETTESFYEVDGLDELYIPAKGGYEFSGWYTNRNFTGDKVTSIPANSTENIKLYGKFIPNTYTVTFEVDGVTVDLDFPTYDVSDAAIALPAIPEKVGYIILGWYTADGRLMEENAIAAGYFGNLELHAEYTKQTYKITYYLGGGTNDERNVTEYLFEEVPTLYAAGHKSGYNFAGWYTNANFSGTPIESLENYANQDVTLFALWIPDISGENGNETPPAPF